MLSMALGPPGPDGLFRCGLEAALQARLGMGNIGYRGPGGQGTSSPLQAFEALFSNSKYSTRISHVVIYVLLPLYRHCVARGRVSLPCWTVS